jgi:hypothetical protein
MVSLDLVPREFALAAIRGATWTTNERLFIAHKRTNEIRAIETARSSRKDFIKISVNL